MDVAYDHIQEEAMSPDEPKPEDSTADKRRPSDLRTELGETYKAISSSPWASRLSDFFGQVKKQGASYYEGARQELSLASNEASKGFTDLMSPTNALAVSETPADADKKDDLPKADIASNPPAEVPESLPADIVKEAESMLSRFRVEATARLKQIEKAEDAADEALLKFGTNIRNFLRDAVTIAPPTIEEDGRVKRDVLFESKDIEGKRVVHATRFDAQLHVIHSTLSSFSQDPESEDYAKWKEDFDVEKKTDAIAKDLDKYEELRSAMEKLVPEKVDYVDFWKRYYFLRHVIETEEQKRRELLRGTLADEEEVAWDDDDEDETQVSTPNTRREKSADDGDKASTPTKTTFGGDANLLKPNDPRRSNEHSVADSDASYDIVSGATSRTPGSPLEEKELDKRKLAGAAAAAEESDEDDWE